MHRLVRLLIALVLFLPLVAQADGPQTIYVAPYGTPGAVGDADHPRTLGSVLAAGGVVPGTTVYLIPGTYSGTWRSDVAGAPDARITIRSEPGTRARLDGSLTIAGADTTWRDIEIADTSWLTRTTATSVQAARSLSVQAPRVTLINNYIHDLAGGVYAFNGASGASADLTARSNLIYHIGYGPGLGRGTGHAIYIQNDAAGSKLLQDNILINQYGFGVHAYGSSNPSAALDHLTFAGNIQVNNRWLVGGGRPLRDLHIRGSRLYNSLMQIGYNNQANEDVEIAGNWIGNYRLQTQWVLTPTVRLNRIVGAVGDTVVYAYPPLPASANWDTNNYYRTGGGIDPFGIDGQGFYSLASWRTQTGYDATSTFSGALPGSNWIDIRPNADDPNRVTFAIYNWTNAPTVTLNLAPLNLTSGARYRLVNAANPTETMAVTAGSPVVVLMSGWSVAMPMGASAPIAASTFPQFGTFLVEPAP